MAPTPKNHFGIRRHRNKQLPPPQGTGYTPISSKQPPFPIPFSFHSQDVVPDLTVFSIVILIMDRIEQKSNCSDVTLPIEISPFYTSPPRWAASEEKYFWRFRKLETAVACCGRRGLTGNGKRRHRRRKTSGRQPGILMLRHLPGRISGRCELSSGRARAVHVPWRRRPVPGSPRSPSRCDAPPRPEVRGSAPP